jgi:hypothetical protein
MVRMRMKYPLEKDHKPRPCNSPETAAFIWGTPEAEAMR